MKVLVLLLVAMVMLDLATPALAEDEGPEPKDGVSVCNLTSPLAFSSHGMFIFQEADLTCYIHGQCQEFSIDFKFSDDPDECGHFCRKKNNALDKEDPHRCNWWSWEPAQELCIMFHNCTTSADGSPSGLLCPDCISGMGE